MNPPPSPSKVPAELIEIRRESWRYLSKKPGNVPPADSPSRPALAALWRAAHDAVTARPKARTFTYAGARFGVVYLGGRLCAMDWTTRAVLVRPSTSTEPPATNRPACSVAFAPRPAH